MVVSDNPPNSSVLKPYSVIFRFQNEKASPSSSMADNDVFINGVNGESSEFLDADHPSKNANTAVAVDVDTDVDAVDHLNQRIEALERDNSNLVKENSASAERIVELKAEIDSLWREKEAALESSVMDKKAAAAIAKRAAELEGDAFRYQHDLISAMNEVEEANREVQDLKAKIRELEEQAMGEKEEREREIDGLKRDKKEAEESVGELQALLNESKEKVRGMEKKMEELVEKSQESEKLVGGLMEKIAEKERETAIVEEDVDDQSKGFKGLKSQLPLIGAVSAGAIVAAASVCYIRYSRNR